MELIIYNNIPCPILLKEEPDTFLILFKDEQKWIFRCSLGYGEIIKSGNGICYIFNVNLHRENGPAVEYSNGSKCWYKNGERHREDGPAIERPDEYEEWWINGLQYSKEFYNKKIEKIEKMKRNESYNI